MYGGEGFDKIYGGANVWGLIAKGEADEDFIKGGDDALGNVFIWGDYAYDAEHEDPDFEGAADKIRD